MPVTIRKEKLRRKEKPKREIKKGAPDVSLLLDITGYGERTKERLKELRLYSKPKTEDEKTHNKNTLATAAAIRLRKETELSNNYHGVHKTKYHSDFIKYFKDYVDGYEKSNKRMYQAVLKKLEAFILKKKMDTLTGNSITPLFCEDFADYLKSCLHHETPKDYFGKFKSVLIRAKKEKVVSIDTSDINVKFKYDSTATRKPLLSLEEIVKLANTPVTQMEIAKAYLFSLNMGFDYATMKKRLKKNTIDGRYVVFDRSKTEGHNRIMMNDTAYALIADRLDGLEPDDLVFNLPTWEMCVRSIRAWATRAGIHKKITWHSARHSLGDILVNDFDVNLKTVQDLFGHKNIKTTQRYTRTRNKNKEDAVANMPALPQLSLVSDKGKT
jgi:integrase/recombinase XerD